jgi:DNA-binding phage protein
MTKMIKTKKKKKKSHWTNESFEEFQYRITFDFISQIEDRIEAMRGMSRKVLAEKLGVTASAVSQILNNPENLELKTIIAYSRALGMKVAVVPYDDFDPDNDNGPINSEIFNECWKTQGRPASFLDLKSSLQMPAETFSEGKFSTNVRFVNFKKKTTGSAMFDPIKKVA